MEDLTFQSNLIIDSNYINKYIFSFYISQHINKVEQTLDNSFLGLSSKKRIPKSQISQIRDGRGFGASQGTIKHGSMQNIGDENEDCEDGGGEQVHLKNQVVIFSYLLQFVKSILVRFMYKDYNMLSVLQYRILDDTSIVLKRKERLKIKQM